MTIQYLLVTFPDQRNVMANGVGVGVTNHMLMLPADEYDITLDGGDCLPASQPVVLGGTSMVKPLVIRFEASAAAVSSDMVAKGLSARPSAFASASACASTSASKSAQPMASANDAVPAKTVKAASKKARSARPKARKDA